MRCPKCHYISFDNGDRCRNCGYQFSLSAQVQDLDLPIQTGNEPEGPLGDLALNERLPLFDAKTHDDRPLVSAPAVPRAPLAVRKPAPAPAPVARAVARRPRVEEPELDLGLPEGLDETFAPPPRPAVVNRIQAEPDMPASQAAVAPATSRLLAALVDLVVIGTIDAAVLHFTLKICGLEYKDAGILPIPPLAAFFLLLNGGYFAAFTAAGGQSIGKMVAGVRVVPDDDDAWTDRVPLGQAVLRSAAYLVSALPAGLGFLPALLSADKRAVHDRLAHTRVVKA